MGAISSTPSSLNADDGLEKSEQKRDRERNGTNWIDRVFTGPRPAPEMHGGPTMAVRTAPPELAPAARTILSMFRWIASSGKEMTFSMSAMSSYFSSACGGCP